MSETVAIFTGLNLEVSDGEAFPRVRLQEERGGRKRRERLTGVRISLAEMAPFNLLLLRSPPTLTRVRPRRDGGILRGVFFLATKKASQDIADCPRVQAMRSQGNTSFGSGGGRVA